MVNAREFLIQALEEVIDGGDISNEELDAAIPDALQLERVEAAAWEELGHWADDEDIRSSDPSYADQKRDVMKDRLAALQGYSEWEIKVGEHQASHLPVWGCILILAAIVGAILVIA